MKVRPLGKFLVVEPMTADERDSGIVVSATSVHIDRVSKGKVLAAGPEVEGVKDGDTVLFMSYDRNRVDLDDTHCYIVDKDDLYAVVKSE